VKIWLLGKRVVCLVRLLAKERPGAWPEGPREAGIGRRRGCQSAPKHTWGASNPLRGRIFLWKKLLRSMRPHHSRRRLSRIPSRKAAAAPEEIYSALS